MRFQVGPIDSKGRIDFTDPCHGDRGKIEMPDAQERFTIGLHTSADSARTNPKRKF